MQPKQLNKIISRAISQIDFIEADLNWIINDLKNMRVSIRNNGGNIEALLQNKEAIIRHVWKLGKAHELLYHGLLRRDGSLTPEAFKYLAKQKEGKIPSGIIPGQVSIEMALFRTTK